MILITGGTGFLAEALIPRLDGRIRIVARNEGKLVEMKHKHPNVEIMPGDLADFCTASKALKDVTDVYHLAAFKHVGMAETETYQCTASNITATMNLLLNFRGKTFTAISTDKAAQVSGVYGATKLIMEKLIEEFEQINTNTKYRVVRYGNVLYSTGSVLCKWKDLIQQGKAVTLTDGNATRFFWTREQAIDHIFECLSKADDSTPYVPEMKAMKMRDLLQAMIQKYANKHIEVKEIGLQAGENMHETMDGKTFSNQVNQYTVEEIIPLI